MNFNYVVALTSLATSSVAAYTGWRFYRRFGRNMSQWGWLLMSAGMVSLVVSEFFDAYVTFQSNDLAQWSDLFAILTELLIAAGFVRLFNRDLVEEKERQQKLESDLSKSEGLLSATAQMTASLDLEKTLHTLLHRTMALTGADMAAIFLGGQGKRRDEKYFVARRNSRQITVRKQAIGPITGQIIASGQPVIIEDVREHPQMFPAGLADKLTFLGGFPLKDNGEILGVLLVGFEQAYTLGESQRLLLAGLANHGALALRNASLYEQVEELSLTDPLTGLANRRQFDQTLSMELARARRYDDPLSLMILDLDRFKQINDTWGHTAGDAALKWIAEILRENTRLADLVARVGGEEIALVLPRSDPAEAVDLAERLRERVQRSPLRWDLKTVPVTCSFGVTGGKGEELPQDPAEMYRQADSALYRAKDKGRNRVVVWRYN